MVLGSYNKMELNDPGASSWSHDPKMRCLQLCKLYGEDGGSVHTAVYDGGDES